MPRLLLLGAALLLASDAFAQSFPREVLAAADNYVIAIHYREAPPRTSRQLHEAYVTVTPVSNRARAFWNGSLRALRLHPARSASRQDGALGLVAVDGGRYFGYGLVPAPGSLRGASFLDYRDVTTVYGIDPDGYDEPDEGGDEGPKEPDTPDNPDTPDDPGDDEEWPLVDPWEEDPPKDTTPGPPIDWDSEIPDDDLVNPWPERTFAGGRFVYLVY